MAAPRGSDPDTNSSRMENGDAGPPNRNLTQMSSPTTADEERKASANREPLMPARKRRSWSSVFNAVKPKKPNWALGSLIESPEFRQKIREKRREEPLVGYPELAEFLGSDERWFIFRKFSHLQARLILDKQEELRLIEIELHDADLADNEESPIVYEDGQRVPVTGGPLFTRRRRAHQNPEVRKELFERADRIFKEYASLLTAVNQLSRLDKPASHEWKSVSRFISTTKPVVQSEAEWIFSREDLVTLRKEREHGHLDAVIETVINRFKNSGWVPRSTDPNGDTKMQRWLRANASAGKAASLINFVFLSFLVPGIFVIPIYVLSLNEVQHSIGQSIGVLIAFATAFLFILWVGTPAKTHEMWSCAAAYLAVLVVFLGVNSNNKNVKGQG